MNRTLALLLALSPALAFGDDLFGGAPPPVPAPGREPAPPPAARTPAPPAEEEAEERPAVEPTLGAQGVDFDPARSRLSHPSNLLEAKTPVGIRIWSAKRVNAKVAILEVQVFSEGDWRTMSFMVNKGDRIGSPKRLGGPQSKSLDFTTRWKLLELKREKLLRTRKISDPVFDAQGVKTGETVREVQEEVETDVLVLQALDEAGAPLADPQGAPVTVRVPCPGPTPLELPELPSKNP